MSLPFNYFNVFPSCRTPNPTNFHPHELCSHCSNPYHSLGDCPHWGQFSNFSHEQMNTSFSSPGFESNSNFYNPDWSNHSDFSWHAHAMGNYAPKVDELHHPDYLQFDNQVSCHSSYDYPPKESSLEETLKEFMELVGQPIIPASQEQSLEDTLEAFRKTINQPCQEIIDVTVANTKAVIRLEGQLGHLVAKFNRIEEEKKEQVEKFDPPQNPIRSNEMEVSIEAHSFVTIPLETQFEPQVLPFQCLEEPSYEEIFRDSRTQNHKSKNRGPKRIFRRELLGYIRWRNILQDGYIVFMKKGWKGLVGHPYERGRCGILFFHFYFPHFIFESFYYLFFLCVFVVCIVVYIKFLLLFVFFVFFILVLFSVPCDQAHHFMLDRLHGLPFELIHVCSSAEAHIAHHTLCTALLECDQTYLGVIEHTQFRTLPRPLFRSFSPLPPHFFSTPYTPPSPSLFSLLPNTSSTPPYTTTAPPYLRCTTTAPPYHHHWPSHHPHFYIPPFFFHFRTNPNFAQNPHFVSNFYLSKAQIHSRLLLCWVSFTFAGGWVRF
jgi:hypothetical protein